MRRCIRGWTHGSFNFRTKFSAFQIGKISTILESFNATKPCDINRAIRGLQHLKLWKGSEYRTLLLYTGLVVLKDFLDEEVFDHFVLLSCMVRILSCNEYTKFYPIARSGLNAYIEKFATLYGIDSVSSNIHNLSHVVDDVIKFGILPNISSYPFENYLGQFKNLVRTGKLPLSQIAKRVSEIAQINILSTETKFPYVTGDDGKKQYKKIILNKNFVLANDEKNKWFLTKCSQIVEMINVKLYEGSYCILGRQIKTKTNLFISPFQSSHLDIYQTTDKTLDAAKLYNVSTIKSKIFTLNYKNKYVFIPIIHTLQ